MSATLIVAAGGFAIGFLVWYAAVTHVATLRSAGDGLLAVTLPAGALLALAGWIQYAAYFARRAGVAYRTALRYDAWSWAGFIVSALWLITPFVPTSMGRPLAAGIGLWAVLKLLSAVRFNQTVRETTITFVLTRIPIIFTAELASIIVAQRPGQHVAESANPLLAVWGRWDAVHYLDIASRGYYGTDMAFFPLYPLLIRIVGGVVGSDLIAGLLISNVALLFGLLFFYKLTEHQFDRHVALRAIFYVSIFPTAVFFSAVYTESLFFCLTVASFYYINERRWILAGILGMLAALTRVEGVLLAVPYAIEALRAFGWREAVAAPRRLWRVILGFTLIPCGLAIYMAVLWLLRGDPLYFSHVQIHWNRHLALPWASVGRSISIILHPHSAPVAVGQVIELSFTALMLAVLILGFRTLRPSAWIYMALSVIIPMCTSSLMSMPRFALVLFPMFIVLALWGRRTWFNSAVVAFSLPLLGLFTVLFTSWYWVA
ncbi:MAG: glycosyltransferase family 39 protein [Candidatus Eremiobacteraeota bacterium]|nr:glycosyltransferase family 39 protein [Candidatus Eremiobacteraeota bacterium]